MKNLRRITVFLFIALLLIACLPLPCSASDDLAEPDAELWREDLRRVNDLSGILDGGDADELNEAAITLLLNRRFDFVVILYNNEHCGGDPDAEYIDYVFRKNGLGYGENGDGIVLALNTQEQTILMEAFGRGSEIFTDEEFQKVSLAVRQGFASGRYRGAVADFLEAASDSVARSGVEYRGAVQHYKGEMISYGPASLNELVMPDWYPADTDAWVWSPAPEGTPRVVDDADIFTDSEEAALEAKIASFIEAHAADVVIFTDTTTHGLSRAVYAADFYDFNGYGCGPEHDGFCLLLCMDPNSRGGWCCVTGSKPRRLYTEENANALDDVLYAYLGEGEYYAGVSDWIDNLGTLLEKGVPFAPEWYPAEGESFVRRADPNAPRIADNSGLFTAEQAEALRKKAAAISEKYGIDVAILTDRASAFSPQRHTDLYYKYNGYGFGESFDGVMLSLIDKPRMHCEGKAAEKLTDLNIERLLEGAEGPFAADNYYKSADRWLDYLDKTLKTGRTPRTPVVWSIRSAIAAALSLLSSGASMSRAKSSMKTVRTAYTAGDHLVRDSFSMGGGYDRFTHNTVTRVYSPISHDSGGKTGSSGGGSSYSGGYSGSSGSSHSGSGRDF